MAEFNSAEKLNTQQLPYSDSLEIGYLCRLFDNTSECYKFFWFQAILTKITEGKTSVTFEELVDEMIADAWYMVSEYHLNLGPKDNLETVVQHIHKITGMKPSEKKGNILSYLSNCGDKEVLRLKKVLIANVPYRLQAPFMPDFKGKDFDMRLEERLMKINAQRRLMYYFERVNGKYHNGLNTVISIEPDWVWYIQKNLEIIKGWLQYNMITYLQKRNPSVPGISDKLYPPQERKLEKVKKYWKLIMKLQPIYEIYGHNPLSENEISIDHFVPWSYVAHDELWNLHPTTRNINSSKSNHLPDWDTYFPLLSKQEYVSYQMMWKSQAVYKEFQQCAREHINNPDVLGRLYRPGLSEQEFRGQLSEILLPVYQSAKNCGFGSWVYENQG